MSELKKCPFCGSENVFQKEYGGVYYRCKDCGMCSPECLGDEDDTAHGYALKAWNTRPVEEALQKENEDQAKKIELLMSKCKEIEDFGCYIHDETGHMCGIASEKERLKGILSKWVEYDIRLQRGDSPSFDEYCDLVKESEVSNE